MNADSNAGFLSCSQFSSFEMIYLRVTLIQLLLFLQGEYFFELDDKSILPGYPKLIKDVWGIPGPIDAAFTRINCQGKSYIFKVKYRNL